MVAPQNWLGDFVPVGIAHYLGTHRRPRAQSAGVIYAIAPGLAGALAGIMHTPNSADGGA